MKNKSDDKALPEPQSFEELDRQIEEDTKTTRFLLGSDALTKACFDDPFDYAMRLRTGDVIRFSGAKVLNAEWIHVTPMSRDEQPPGVRTVFPGERGIDVRIRDIVWVMDAPCGS